MPIKEIPLVLVHGLWNTPNLFHRLVASLNQSSFLVSAPYLVHKFGRVSLRTLAKDLDEYIIERWGIDMPIDLLGFSMGGVVGRIWLQQFGGAARTRRFFSVGSPQQGTLTAQVVPSCLLCGVAEMKFGSPLLQELNSDFASLNHVKCKSFFCRLDLMAFPGWQAVLPIGESYSIPVLTHKGLITHPKALKILKEVLIIDDLKDHNVV